MFSAPKMRQRSILRYKGLNRTTQAIFLMLVMSIAAVIGVSLGWVFRTKSLDSTLLLPYQGRIIRLELTMLSVDPVTQGGSFTVSWAIREDTCVYDFTPPPSNCSTVNIYMDANLFAGAKTLDSKGSSSIPTTPIFVLDPVGYDSYFGNAPTFQTNLVIWQRGRDENEARDSLVNYPFDNYNAEIFMFARTNDTNDTVGLQVLQTDGTAFGFDTSIEPYSSTSDTVVDEDPSASGSLDLLLVIKRTVLVKAYVMVLIVAMWLITLILLGITIKAVLFGCGIESAILVVPVATLFAFTTLRQSMPGSPAAFGAYIDFVGTLPSLALLVMATVVCLLHTLFSHTGIKVTGNRESANSISGPASRDKDLEGQLPSLGK